MFFTWKVGVENYAANKATIVEPTDLLSSILADQEWNACALNRAHSPGGTLNIAPRPLPPLHVPIIAGMTNSAISVAKYSNDRHQIWRDALATFKSRLIRSLGPTLEGTIGPPPDGFKLLAVQQIMDDVRTKYGTVDQMALAKMEEVLTTMWQIWTSTSLRSSNICSCKLRQGTPSRSTARCAYSGSQCRATTR